jgi:hypothetical protein
VGLVLELKGSGYIEAVASSAACCLLPAGPLESCMDQHAFLKHRIMMLVIMLDQLQSAAV